MTTVKISDLLRTGGSSAADVEITPDAAIGLESDNAADAIDELASDTQQLKAAVEDLEGPLSDLTPLP